MGLLRRRPPAPPARPPRPTRVGAPAAALTGVDPTGAPAQLPVAGDTALLFLTSSCQPCQAFWRQLADDPGLPGGLPVAVATPGAALESRRKVADLAPDGVAVVLSGQAWDDYGVTGSPFAVIVRAGTVVAEGPVLAWGDLLALLG
jgi:hypothetical protein